YNRDDCVSALRLRDWLEERRAELEWTADAALPRPEPRDADASEEAAELSARVADLVRRLTEDVPADEAARTPEQHARWLLAHLLQWHRREWRSFWWEYFRLKALTAEELVHERSALGELEYVGPQEQ